MCVTMPDGIIHLSSDSNAWYTPSWLVEAARCALGGAIDLDPASCAEANCTVGARTFYTEEDDGLGRPWFGNVFLNPPYGRAGPKSGAGVWLERAVVDHDRGAVTAAVVVLKAAVGYGWFNQVWSRHVCFLTKRVVFTRGTSAPPPTSSREYAHPCGTAVVYLGRDTRRFVDAFDRLGEIHVPFSVVRELGYPNAPPPKKLESLEHSYNI